MKPGVIYQTQLTVSFRQFSTSRKRITYVVPHELFSVMADILFILQSKGLYPQFKWKELEYGKYESLPLVYELFLKNFN